LRETAQVLDCGNSGTTARLLLGILAALPATSRMTGDESLRRRPMGRVVEPLRSMGADIDGEEGGRFLPLLVRGGGLKGLKYSLPVASAQIKSALLLAGLVSGEAVEIREPARSRDHTEKMLAYLGGQVECSRQVIRLSPGQRLTGRPISVPGDISSAAFFLTAAALVPGSKLIIHNVGVNPTRSGVLDILRQMGAEIRIISQREMAGEPAASLLVEASALKGVEIRGSMIPRLIDEIPVLAVAALFARGETVIRDAAELRVKETDRIKAVVTELKKLGARVEELPDGLVIQGGGKLTGGKVKTYNDHRMAMALHVAGLAAGQEVLLDNSRCVNISFPNYFSLMEDIRT
jgi:3-phosphoshikimate 1-carboxyvinyltransferase